MSTRMGGVAGNPLDEALWPHAGAQHSLGDAAHRVAFLPFDHIRRATSALIDDNGKRILVVKGAPEQVMAKCSSPPDAALKSLAGLFAAGRRVVAVAVKPAPGLATITPADESNLMLVGFLVFADQPKLSARQSLARLDELSIEVKVATGDNPVVAEKVCSELGLASKGTISGAEMEHFSDEDFRKAAESHTIFARVSPEQKSRLITATRKSGKSVGYLGDGVNDASALHAADVGISVDSATDVAKDAADVVLLEKDLGVLATGVAEGRRIFANTIKYVLMSTSSNFGNTFSAAAASAFLPFLPMLPSQILLNNLLYDTSQLAIPTDNVGPRAAAEALTLGRRVHPPFHADVRTGQLPVRLPDIRADARRSARQRAGVPHRLVRRIACYPDAYRLRDPNSKGAVPPQ